MCRDVSPPHFSCSDIYLHSVAPFLHTAQVLLETSWSACVASSGVLVTMEMDCPSKRAGSTGADGYLYKLCCCRCQRDGSVVRVAVLLQDLGLLKAPTWWLTSISDCNPGDSHPLLASSDDTKHT